MTFSSTRTALAFVVSMGLGSSMAFAQATRTWVSGVGNDANPCSRTAPCKTFAGAISKTATGGEISVLDPGGYGGVTITKPITISGVGTQASILASGTSGIIVNITAPPADPQTNTVTLRNLQINGAGVTLGVNGVRVLNATTVIMDHVNVFGFGTNGVISENTSKVSISDGVFSNNAIAVHSKDTSTLTVENSQINGNNIAVQADLGSELRLSNNGVYDNKTGFACGTGGNIASTGNNRKAGNVGGVVPTCAPTVVITIQ
jgi:nitrous oxidase accessory protein NosD